jgi:hypothetical protein
MNVLMFRAGKELEELHRTIAKFTPNRGYQKSPRFSLQTAQGGRDWGKAGENRACAPNKENKLTESGID